MPGRPLLLALAVALVGCGSTENLGDPGVEVASLAGGWRGGMVQEGAGSLPATLSVSEEGSGLAVTLVAGAIRVTTDDVEVRRGRFQFRAPDFPVSRTSRRTLRCDLDPNAGFRELRGRCYAGPATYRLSLRRSGAY